MVASSPIARCRNPPTLALAYISPARSSKRRMSIIASSHSRATSVSGRSPIGANGSDCGLAEAQAGHLAPAGVRSHDRPQRAGAHEREPLAIPEVLERCGDHQPPQIAPARVACERPPLDQQRAEREHEAVGEGEAEQHRGVGGEIQPKTSPTEQYARPATSTTGPSASKTRKNGIASAPLLMR